jgi:long-chain acyl-CoA synthetase
VRPCPAPARRAARARLGYNPVIPESFYDLFAASAQRFHARVATELQRRDRVDRLTYAELAALAGRGAAWLTAHGVRRGDRVPIIAENDGTWCGAYLGVLRAGAVAVPLDTNYSSDQVAKLLKDCGASAVLTSRQFAPLAQAAMQLGAPRPIADIHADFDGQVEQPPVHAGGDEPAVILYTSGTTADPKGVVMTHRNIIAERTGAFQLVHVDERDAVLSVLPLFHALAQMANLLLPFSVGARVVYLETLNTTELTRALQERGITAFVCVPQFFYLLHEKIDGRIRALPMPVRALVRGLAAANLRVRRSLRLNPGGLLFRGIHRSLGPHLRLLVTGGARFDPSINEALFALGFSIRQAYGLTECSGAATVSDEGEPHLESVGRVLPGNELRIDASEGEEGEVLIRGPIVMQGYFNRPDQNASTLKDGWLHTGDLGRIDGQGRLFITGRSKEVIVLGSGKNIYPEEIEAHYERSPFIEELCVVGVSRPGEPTSERLHAVIRPDAEALRARGAVNMRELVRFELEGLSVQLPAHKRILGFDITLDPLPRTTTKKLKRFEIQKQIATRKEERRGGDEDAAAWPGDAATQRILGIIREQVRTDAPVVPASHLELDLGLDSMERVELFVHLTGTLQVEIPDEAAQQLHTAGELVEACRSRLREGWETAERVQPWERLLQEPPADAGVLSELHKAKRIRAALLFVALKTVSAILHLAVGLRVRGRRHIPAGGPFVISPNHQSYVDAFLLVGALPFRAFKEMFFVGAAEYFQTPLMRWVARVVNVIPIDPDSNLVAAMQAGAYGLRQNKVLVLFPEGERSIDGTVKEFRKGAAILSHHTKSPIVPVAIDGAWDMWARGRSINWRAWLPWAGTRARVEFLPPLPPLADADYASQTRVLRARVEGTWRSLHEERAGAYNLP